MSLARSPIARFGGSFASLTAPKLGAQVLEAALARGNVAKESVEEVYLGNVVSAGVGQAPTRQAGTSLNHFGPGHSLLPKQLLDSTLSFLCS